MFTKLNPARKFFIALAAVLVLLLLVGVVLNLTKAAENPVEERIAAHLTAFGDQNCELVGEEEFDSGLTYTKYHSKDGAYDYFFTEEGDLRIVRGEDDLVAEAALGENEIQQCVLAFANACIAPYRIGDLEIVTFNNFTEGYYNCTLVERYDDMQTGTQVEIFCLQDGTITDAIITKGAVFENHGGKPTLKQEIAVTAEEATTIAQNHVAEKISETGLAEVETTTTCALEAYADQQYYLVTICGTLVEEDFEYEQSIFVKVSVTDGAVLDMTWSQ